MKVISRKEASEKGLKKYFTGKPCSKGHVCEKRVSNYECLACSTSRVTNDNYKLRRNTNNKSKSSKMKNKVRMSRYLSNHTKEEILSNRKNYSNGYANYLTYKDQLTLEEAPNSCGDLLEVKCANCREYFKPKQMHVNKRIQCLKGNYNGESRLYCSESCKSNCSIYNKQGIMDYTTYVDRRPLQNQWSKLVKERDDNTCQICGVKENIIIAHHIEPVSQNPIESADIDNGITLCKTCDKKVHQLPGCTYHDLRC